MSDHKPDGALRNTIYRQVTVSGRRMGPMRRWLYRLAAPAAAGAHAVWWRSCRIVVVVGEEHLDAVLARWPSFLPCYWHQHQLFCARYLLLQQRSRPLRLGFLISPSVDGELGAMIVRRARRLCDPRVLLAHRSAGAQGLFRGADAREGVADHHAGRPARSALQVQAGRDPAGADVRPADAADGLRRLARRAGALGSLRAAAAVLRVSRSRIGPPREVPRTLDAAALAALQLEMQQSLQATFAAAQAALAARATGLGSGAAGMARCHGQRCALSVQS